MLILPTSQVPSITVELEYPDNIDGEPMADCLDWMRSAYLVSATGCPALSMPTGAASAGRRRALCVRTDGYSGAMNRLEHLDKSLVDELTRAAREAVRDELREQTRGQRRKAALYAGAGAFGLYAGAALALAFGLALALGLPDWAAALITAVVLGGVAYLMRNAARPSAGRPSAGRPSADRASLDRTSTDLPSADRPSADPPSVDGPVVTPPPVTPSAPERPTAPPTVDATHPGGVEPEVPHRWGQ